ncbi:MAG: S53 family serine peptidase [Dokdonella sp.]
MNGLHPSATPLFTAAAQRRARPLTSALFALGLLLTATASATERDAVVGTVDNAKRIAIVDQRLRWASVENDRGPVAEYLPLDHMSLTLRRTPERQQAWETFVSEQKDPTSANYQHWLTSNEIGERFGASQHDIDSIRAWLSAQGLHVDGVSNSRMRVGFSGNAKNVATAFATELHYFGTGAEKRIANTMDATIPVAFASAVQSVSGLHSMKFKPAHHASAPQSRSIGATSPQPAGTHCTGSDCEHFVFPADFAKIYNLNAANLQGIDGAGQTIAIVGRSRIYDPDIANFQSLNGLPARPANVIVPPDGIDPGPPASTCSDTGTPSCTTPDDALSDQFEATLDVQRAGSVAPGAAIALIVAKDSDTSNGIQLAIEYAIDTTPLPAHVLSISYLSCEADNGMAVVRSIDELFTQAAAEGISVFVASGDSGAAGCADQTEAPPVSQSPGTNALCSSGAVSCVGGTEFADTAQPALYWAGNNGSNYLSALGYIPEGAWNEPLSDSGVPHLSSTGGGVSLYIAKPTWQAGVGVPGNQGRYTPDVSFTASRHDGYFTCVAAQKGSCAVSAGSFSFIVSSGTSASAPSMAGVAALLNQKIGAPQGNLNPRLYALAANPANHVFHDVTFASSGVADCSLTVPSLCNNSTPGADGIAGGLPGFTVETGYDRATGLGSMDVGNLVAQWNVPQVVAVNLNQRGLSGTWANPSTDGQGFVTDVAPNFYGTGSGLLFGGWYTYDTTAAGGQRWYTIQGAVGPGASASLPIYSTEGGKFDSAQATAIHPIGAATLQFSDCEHGVLTYHFDDRSHPDGTIPLTRLLANLGCTPAGGTAIQAEYLLGGTWADLSNSGQGLVFDLGKLTSSNILFAGWYTYARNGDQSSGGAGQRWYTLQAAYASGATTLNGVGIFETTGGVFDHSATTLIEPVGTANLVFHSCSSATMSYAFSSGSNAGLTGTLDLTRITPGPSACHL